jgi:hypothetical protein
MRSGYELGTGTGARVLACLAFVWSSMVVAQGEHEAVTAAHLREELAKRDAIIIELLNRIEALEVERGVSPSGSDLSRVEARAVDNNVVDTPEGTPPRDFDVEELRAERALERGLVERGARLLAPGQIELVPRVRLSHDEGMFPVALMDDGGTRIGEIERTFDLYERRADVRLGLPLGLQLEVGVPYLSIDQQMKTGINGAVQSAVDQSGSGEGDATLGLAKAFGADGSQGPTVIGRLVWLTGSGDERDGAVLLGGGHSGLNAQATAYWRRDPVVFLMSGGYTYFEEKDSLQRGDSFSLSLGLGLAISPEAALLFSLDQARTSKFSRAGVALPGTERLSSSLGLSAQTLLGRKFSLGVDADVGLTDDAADYRFGVSFSSRFSARPHR